MTNSPKRKRQKDSIIDHSVTRKHKHNPNPNANLNQVQNTNQSNELANQKRKKHRTRHRKAKNQRALETDTEYPPKPSQMKNKNSLQPFQKKKTTLQSPQKKNTNQQPPQKKKISPQSPQKNTNITESHQLKAEKTAIASQTSKSKAPVSIKTATELDFVSTIPNNTLNIEDSSDEESFHTCSSNPQSLQSESILHTPAFPFHQPSSESKSDSSAIEAFSPQSTNPEQLVPRSPSLLSPESWQRTPPAFSPLTPSLKRDQLSISQTLPKLSSSQIMQSSLVKKLDSIVLISSSDEEDDEDVILISDSDAEEVVTSSYTTDPARPLCTLENKVSLYAKDLKYLKPKQWLNDTIIDFSALMFQRIYNAESTTFISSSFFFTRLTQEKKNGNDYYEKTKKWLKNADLFNKKLWLIPVCQRSHWYLIAVIRPGSSKRSYIIVMDSLFNPRLEDVTLIKEFLRKKLREDKGKELFIRNIKSITIPQQRNSYDCGLYLLRSIEVFLKRRNRVIELIKGKADYNFAENPLWGRVPVYTRNQLRGKILAFCNDDSQ